MKIEFNDREPIYLQIIRSFKQQMVMGILEPGETIPSRRELAQGLKVNANTVQRAYKEMEELGMIVTFRNFQSTVTKDEAIIDGLREQLVYEAVDTFLSSMKAISVPKDEVVKIISDRY